MRVSLLLAAAYHVFFALWTNCWPYHGFDLLDIPRPNHPILWRTLGLISGFLGFAFLIAASDPIKHWMIVLFGFLKVIFVSGAISYAVFSGNLTSTAFLFLFIDDLVWIIPMGMILWSTIRAMAGIPISRQTPYSIEEAAHIYHLSNGKSLAEASQDKPLVLVFLRHFGCTFTRQILRGLQDLEQQAQRNNAELVLVHMMKSGDEVEYLGGNSDVPRIADHRCELYRSFGLGKGGFIELFGPQVIWRGLIAIFRGCGMGHLAGDGLQMPGAFIFQNGIVISSQPARSASDLPDLTLLFMKTKSV